MRKASGLGLARGYACPLQIEGAAERTHVEKRIVFVFQVLVVRSYRP
jgi:hypothetical protein